LFVEKKYLKFAAENLNPMQQLEKKYQEYFQKINFQTSLQQNFGVA
jgi:hypothetical protein